MYIIIILLIVYLIYDKLKILFKKFSSNIHDIHYMYMKLCSAIEDIKLSVDMIDFNDIS